MDFTIDLEQLTREAWPKMDMSNAQAIVIKIIFISGLRSQMQELMLQQTQCFKRLLNITGLSQMVQDQLHSYGTAPCLGTAGGSTSATH